MAASVFVVTGLATSVETTGPALPECCFPETADAGVTGGALGQHVDNKTNSARFTHGNYHVGRGNGA